ncbi:hypothetical protein B0H14DRAFT_3040665 [Mycena olivaceomarginata]|nr:hypothetical protein B0H14DRAFT_3040665 [Mycena olivaceomarginata]
MSVLPPELLDAIICEIDDTQTLKACSLVATTLCSSSQRILLDSLTVDVYNDTAICKLLTESPHVSEYIRASVKTLAPLQNVRRCFLDGSGDSNPPRRFRFLGVSSCTTSYFCNFVKVIPTLYFDFVEIEIGADVASDPTVLSPFAGKSALTSLSCIGKDAGQFLARAKNISCVATLRHLSVSSRDDGWVGALIEAASHTLETIEFDCSRPSIYPFARSPILTHRAGYPPPPALPRLPALQSVEFAFSDELLPAARADIISRTATVLQALAVPQASPALAKLVFKQNISYRPAHSLDSRQDRQRRHAVYVFRRQRAHRAPVLEAYLSPGVRGNEVS